MGVEPGESAVPPGRQADSVAVAGGVAPDENPLAGVFALLWRLKGIAGSACRR
jgi:hypothetical protein